MSQNELQKLEADYKKAVQDVNDDSDLSNSQKQSKLARLKEVYDAQVAADGENDNRTGKGTRIAVAQTRGKGSMVISYEAFDTDKPDTLPANLEEFVNLTKITDESALAGLLVAGFNAQSYSEASDPVAEFINPLWPDAVKKSFKLAVKNTASAAGITIEQASAVIKPGVEKKFAADAASQQA